MNILIATALAIILMAWVTYDHDDHWRGYPDKATEPYEMEDRDN